MNNQPRLLLVEDEESLRKAITRILSSSFEVKAIGNGADAAELLMTDDGNNSFDVVLSDIGHAGLTSIIRNIESSTVKKTRPSSRR